MRFPFFWSLACLLMSGMALLPMRSRSQSVSPTEPDKNGRRVSIIQHGALGDGTKINTTAIQKTIDALAASGGGTVVIPKGDFLSGAVFLKPKVNLHLEKDAILRCSTDMRHFPEQRTRIEGHFARFNPALINANGCDGLKITGEGTLDGAGRPIWDQFWKMRRAAKNPKDFRNLSVPRARLCLIENSKDIGLHGITFKDSQFWNLHLYKCSGVTVDGLKFVVPDDYKQAPSTDGIDIDSSQDVLVEKCYFSVTDDCVAMKGTRGPRALEDKASPPTERIRVRDCTFKRGHAAVTFGSEATVVRDLVVENCRIIGGMSVANFKLRSDTPQTYENVNYRNLVLDSDRGAILSVQPWGQYIDLEGMPPPMSVVRDISFSNIRGRFGSFGIIQDNPDQTTIDGISLMNIDLILRDRKLKTGNLRNLGFDNVRINGEVARTPVSSKS